MNGHRDLGELLKEALAEEYTIRQLDIGADARLAKKGMVFRTESYAVEGLGHLCVLRMDAFLGLMKMETVVLAAETKDLPLVNLDWVRAFGKETQIAELYDTQLQPYPQAALDAFQQIRDRDADLPDPPPSAPRWYDAILYPCSYHKSGKGIGGRLAQAAADYCKTFAGQLETADPCDREAKHAKTRAFAETLFANGGPAVDQVTKLFGPEVARRLVVGHMYGVQEEG
ncbi:MAG: hypothetical protein IK095_02410 [Oscillospiraceae bacterium]|nr:hypothetical protein [Oscillospiraceae bacterium]